MSKIKQIWIMPDYSQSDELEVISSNRKNKLCDEIDTHQLPNVLRLGVPQELINKYGSDEPIYSQLVRSEDKQYFSVSMCCGRDKDGRVIHLTYLEISNLEDSPTLDLPTKWLPQAEKERAEIVKQRIEQNTDRWTLGIKKMLEALCNKKEINSFANVETPKAYYSPEWTPQEANSRRFQLLIGLGAVTVIAASVWYIWFSNVLDKDSSDTSNTVLQRGTQSKDISLHDK